MTTDEAIATLERHNAWRRADHDDMVDPRDIGIAMDTLIRDMREHIAARKEALDAFRAIWPTEPQHSEARRLLRALEGQAETTSMTEDR